MQRVFFHDVNAATVAVLAAEGFEVYAPAEPRCCGALQLHAGEDDAGAGARQARRSRSFEGCDHVVVNAAGCGSAMKDYGHLLREDPEWAERAPSVSRRVRDANEFLAEHEPRRRARRCRRKRRLPRRLPPRPRPGGARRSRASCCASIPGVELVEPPEWEICCGSAGIYNLVQPDAAAELGRRKARNLLDTGAEVVAAANPGCAIQIAAHSERLGHRMPVLHPMELLHKSIQGGDRWQRRSAALR